MSPLIGLPRGARQLVPLVVIRVLVDVLWYRMDTSVMVLRCELKPPICHPDLVWDGNLEARPKVVLLDGDYELSRVIGVGNHGGSGRVSLLIRLGTV